MSWDRIEGHRSPKAVTVRVAVHKPSGFNPYHQMRVHIGNEVLAKLGWSNGVAVDAFHGTGADQGWMSVQLSERGRFKLISKRNAKNGSVIFSTNRLPPGSLEREHRATTCQFMIFPEGLRIKMPPTLYPKQSPSSVYSPGEKSAETRGNKKNGHLTV